MGIPLKGDFQISAKENIIEWGHHQFKIRPNKKIMHCSKSDPSTNYSIWFKFLKYF